MKKVGIIALLIVLVLGGCDFEMPGIPKITILTTESLGTSEISLNVQYGGPARGLLVVERGSQFEIYNGGEEPVIISSEDGANHTAVDSIFDALLVSNYLNDSAGSDLPQERINGHFYLNTSFSPGALSRYFPQENVDSFSAEFSIALGDRIDTRVLFITQDFGATAAVAYEGQIIAEFFKGEDTFFTALDPNGQYSYEEKAMAFLSTFWNTSALYNDFKDVLEDTYDMPASALRSAIEANATLGTLQNALRMSMIEHFKPAVEDGEGDIKRYFSKFRGSFFSNIYGNKKSPYIGAYLLYCFAKGKPVLSKVMETQVDNYNYRNYETFNGSIDILGVSVNQEGGDFADNALRYLTWGVEYTPYTSFSRSTYSTVDTKRTEVYKHFRPLVDKWIDFAGNDKGDNYLPNGTDIATYTAANLSDAAEDINTSTHIFTNDITADSFRIFGTKNSSAASIKVKHVDLWTANNIVWSGNTIKNVVIEGGNNPANKNNLYNRNVFSEDQNEIISVQTDTNKKFSLGYEFMDNQEVGGIILAYQRKNIGNYSRTKTKSMTVSVLQNGEWTEAGSYEMNLDEKNGLTLWGTTTSGFTIAEDNFYNTNDTDNILDGVAYCYIVLNEKQTCDGIKVNYQYDHSSVYSIDMVEMMVFDANPVEYFPREEEVVFSNIFSEHGYYKEGLNAATRNITTDTVDMKFKFANDREYSIKTAVVWEDPATPSSSNVDGFLAMTDGEMDITYLKPYKFSEVVKGKTIALTTPFYENHGILYGKEYFGNPLPYLPSGIDTPRTFAYKMREQYRAKKFFKDGIASLFDKDRITGSVSMMALDSDGDENYFEGYVLEQDLLKVSMTSRLANGEIRNHRDGPNSLLLRPYLPGKIVDSKLGYTAEINHTSHIDKLAGVDSLGILSGSLAMLNGSSGVTVHGYTDIEISDLLDKYTQMSSAHKDLPGLDYSGKPVYAAQENDSFLDGNYRFTPADLERASVLVPELKLIQKGDLLVRYSTELGDTHVGIVVDFDTDLLDGGTTADIQAFMQSVVVISVRRGFKMVTLGTWGNPENSFGGFSLEPENYQLRRLLKLKEGNAAEEDDPWELIELRYERLDLEINFADTTWDHYIPNTPGIINNREFEKTDLESIILKGILLGETETSVLNGADRNITILPPRDFGFLRLEAAAGETSNVNTNKGSGIAFYVKDNSTGTDAYHELARFTIKTDFNIANVTGDTYYDITYNTAYFHNSGDSVGQPRTGSALFAEENGTLRFTSTTGNIDSTTFAVAAVGNDFQPGDDFLLRFGLASSRNIAGTANEGDFLACYDKKMLWRACLYIDERKDTNGLWFLDRNEGESDAAYLARRQLPWAGLSQADQNALTPLDWNGRHPWIEGNEWIEDENRQTGGQITINPWTPHNNWDTVHNSISYGWGCWDSLPGYNSELEAQATAIRNHRNNNATYAGLNWTAGSTIAPGGNWDNYLFPARKHVDASYTNRAGQVIEYQYYEYREQHTAAEIAAAEQHPYYVNGSAASIPGLSTFLAFLRDNDRNEELDDNNPYDRNYAGWMQNARTSGIDCSGFTSRTAQYANDSYVFDGKLSSTMFNRDENSRLLTNRNHMVPGDILVINGHIAFVYEITYPQGGRRVEEASQHVRLIESANGGQRYRVIDDLRWSNRANYFLRRLNRN